MRRTHLAGGGGRNQGQLLSLSHAAAAVSFKTAHPSLEIMASAARARRDSGAFGKQASLLFTVLDKGQWLGQRRWVVPQWLSERSSLFMLGQYSGTLPLAPSSVRTVPNRLPLGSVPTTHFCIRPTNVVTRTHVSTNAVGLSPPPTQSIEIRAYRPRARAG